MLAIGVSCFEAIAHLAKKLHVRLSMPFALKKAHLTGLNRGKKMNPFSRRELHG